MKLVVFLGVSLLLHCLLNQRQWIEVPKAPNSSAGRAAFALLQAHVVSESSTRTANEHKEEIEETVEAETTNEIVEQALPVAKIIKRPPSVEVNSKQAGTNEPTEELNEQQVTNKPVVEEAILDEVDEVEDRKLVSTIDLESENAGLGRIPTMEQPRYREAFPPKYPKLARRRGYQGVVMVRAKVDVNGRVETVEIVTSSGYSSLDNSALKTVAKWQFHPYKVNNRLSVAWVEVPVEFTLAM